MLYKTKSHFAFFRAKNLKIEVTSDCGRMFVIVPQWEYSINISILTGELLKIIYA